MHTKVLGHGVGLQGKRVKFVGVDGELLLDRGQRLVVDEEEDLDVLVFPYPEHRNGTRSLQSRKQHGKPRS